MSITRIGPDDPNDEVAAALRAGLRRQADAVEPGDRFADVLATIEEESQTTKANRWRLIAVAAVLLLGLGIAVPFVLPHKSSSPASQPAPSATSPSDVSSLPTLERQLPIYYVGAKNQLLYREFRDLPNQSDALTTAVNAVLTVAPLDPDYRSEWGPGQVLSARVSGRVITIDLSDQAFSGFTKPDAAQRAIHQMVYTATATVGDSSLSVRILKSGSPVLPNAIQPDAGFVRVGTAPLAPVFLIQPVNMAQAPAGKVFVEGYVTANSPLGELVVVNTATKAQVAAVKLTPQAPQAGWQRFIASVQLPAGNYVLTVSSGAQTDSKTIELG